MAACCWTWACWRPRDPTFHTRSLTVDEPAVVEWRALTVVGLDRLAPLVRTELGVAEAAFPLARMLEGGTWAAGRKIAAARRAGGGAAGPHRERRDRVLNGRVKKMKHEFPNLNVVDHPLIKHKLTQLRNEDTNTEQFRRLVREVGQMLAYEVTRDLPTTNVRIRTPLAEIDAPMISGKQQCLVSILRAGNGMLDGMLELLPAANVGHIGLYRDPATLEPVEYYFKVPSDIADRMVIVVRPDARHGQLGRGCDQPAQGVRRDDR